MQCKGKKQEFGKRHYYIGKYHLNRLDAIDDVWKSIGSPDGLDYEEEYAVFLGVLP